MKKLNFLEILSNYFIEIKSDGFNFNKFRLIIPFKFQPIFWNVKKKIEFLVNIIELFDWNFNNFELVIPNFNKLSNYLIALKMNRFNFIKFQPIFFFFFQFWLNESI